MYFILYHLWLVMHCNIWSNVSSDWFHIRICYFARSHQMYYMFGFVIWVQNALARVVSGRRKFDHISPVLRQLHLLPVKERIDFKIAHLTFKAKLTGQPSYISDLLHPYQPVRSLRSSIQNRPWDSLCQNCFCFKSILCCSSPDLEQITWSY